MILDVQHTVTKLFFLTMFVNKRIRGHFKLKVYLFIPSSTSKGHVWTFAVKYRPRLMFSLNA